MSNNNNNNKQPPDLTDSLPVATGGLTMEDPAGQVNALESQLKAIGGQDSDFLENLKPAVRKRVEVLRGIQSEHDELEAKVFEERAALEAKYQKQYAPLYSKRYDIVSGAVEVDRANEEDAMDQTDDTVKGVPEFWLTAMKHNVITAKEITQRDEEALKYLKDIKWCRMDDLKGFKLEFFFDTNPFFKNSVLTKEYHMIDYDKPIFEKAIGTTIEWLPRKCLTQKILKKRPKKGSKGAKPCWPSPPEVPADEEEIKEDMAQEHENQMEQDYNIGLTVRDMIIPHAVSLFTGEANQNDEDDDWIEEDEDEGDEDDEDEEETETKKKSQLKAIGGHDSDVLENLKPAIRKRVAVLRGIQSEYDELQAKFFEERAALEAIYQKLYAPLYSKRYDLVTGAVEVDGAKEEDAMDQTDDTEKGVPEFWLTAMKHNLITAKEIKKRDEEALKYLKDIKFMDDPKGFKLEFFFDTNPFFTNSVLTKVYPMETIGTTIEWLPRKCLTKKMLRKKNETFFTRMYYESFFHFFSPPEDESRRWLDISLGCPTNVERRQWVDYSIGFTIRDKIIPHAVSYFTGEANQGVLQGFISVDDEDDEDDEDDDDEIEYYEDHKTKEEAKTKKKSRLKAIGGQDSDVLKNLKPSVTKRVEVLRDIQSEHDELEAKFFEERAALEPKYQKLYAPLYSKRYDIVTGAVEVDGAKEEDAMEEADDTEKGVPEFWLTAMKHNIITAKEITKRDEKALKYLKDIKWCRMNDPKGFKLEFFFDTNPFFGNSVLTKVYHMIDDDEPIFEKTVYHMIDDDKPIFEKTIGTTIEWLHRKCLTQKILKKRPKKGSKNAKPITKTEDCKSFFNFFSPLEVPADEEEMKEDMAKELKNQMEQDFKIGLTIRDRIIRHAVSCFTDNENDILEAIWGQDSDVLINIMPSIKERAEVLRGIQSQIKATEGQDSDLLENLKPAVRKRVEVLRGIQSEHDELEAKFFEERAALQPKYQKLYAPLYSKIYDIVTGAVEVDGAKEEDAMDQTDETEKGVPEFWLTAMKNNVITAKEIKKRDEEALKYLKVIKCMDDPEGFKLEFFFDTNPFFTNCVLTKVYPFFKMKAIGTTIEWLPGKCLTRLSKDSSRKIKSFFNFFSPNEDWLPGYPFDDFERECKDSSIGLTIRDIIIPHAVSWFMGEANPTIDRRISFLLGCYDAKYDEDDDDDEEIEGEIPFILVSYDDKYDEDYDDDDQGRFSIGGRGGPGHPRFFATDDDDEIEDDDDDED